MTTGWAAVVNLAIFRIIDLMTLSNSEITIFGTRLSYENAGALYDHRDLLQNLIERNSVLSAEEKEEMKYHLVVDEERILSSRGNLMPMNSAMKDFFFAVGRFRTEFLEKNLSDISEKLQEAFSL